MSSSCSALRPTPRRSPRSSASRRRRERSRRRPRTRRPRRARRRRQERTSLKPPLEIGGVSHRGVVEPVALELLPASLSRREVLAARLRRTVAEWKTTTWATPSAPVHHDGGTPVALGRPALARARRRVCKDARLHEASAGTASATRGAWLASRRLTYPDARTRVSCMAW